MNTGLSADEEAVATEDPRLKDLPLVFKAIRDQMLLVYTNYQSSTIRWALKALPVVKGVGFVTQPELKKEMEHLDSIKQDRGTQIRGAGE